MGRTAATTTTDRHNGVRAARRRIELTQAQLAEHAGVSRQTIVSVESGGYAPSVYLALALADALDETVESLFAPERHDHAARDTDQTTRQTTGQATDHGKDPR